MPNWLIYTAIGVVLIIGGVIALANPFEATIAATQIVGLVFLVGGFIQLLTVFKAEPDGHRLVNGLTGVLFLLAGVSILVNPLVGALSLTIILGVLFITAGLLRLWLSFRYRETGLFWLLLLTGAASVLIGALIFTDFLAAASTVLGLLLGIELIADGIGLMVYGIATRGRSRRATPE